jgi:hypothetical protein
MEKILATEWLTGLKGTVGFVAVEHGDNGEWCAYVGVADNIDEETDQKSIRSWGARLTLTQAMGFFPEFDSAKYAREE